MDADGQLKIEDLSIVITSSESSMPFQIGCPHCQRNYTLADEMRGKAIRCKDCGKAFKAARRSK